MTKCVSGCYEQGRIDLIEGDEVSFFTSIGKPVARNDCLTGVAIKSSYHHPQLYFLDVFCDFRARGPISIPTPLFVALTEFFLADAGANVNVLPES